jgi:hypothetical protein
VQADFAPLFRDAARDVAFQSLGPQGPIVLGTQTLDPEFEAGMKFLVGARFNEIYRVETSFLGFHHWSVQDTVRDFTETTPVPGGPTIVGNLFSPFSNFGDPAFDLDGNPDGILGLDFNNFARLALRSTYDSVEYNFLVDLPRMRNLESAVLFGGRYTRIHEGAEYETRSNEPVAVGGASVLVSNAVENDLLGLQLGYRARFLVERRMWLDFDIRGAVYHNDLEYRLNYAQSRGNAPLPVVAFADETDAEKTAYSGDISLVMHYLVTPAFAVRFGYQSMWFESLALAAENVIPDGTRVTIQPGGQSAIQFDPLEVNNSGRVVYHGPVAGFVFMW